MNQTQYTTIQAINTISKPFGDELMEFIFDICKNYPVNTELSIAIINNGITSYLGFKKEEYSICYVDNHQHLFEIGSIAKIFTSVLLSSLLQDNRVKLDQNVSKCFNFPFNNQESFTFKQLANHTSGLPRAHFKSLLSIDYSDPYKDFDERFLVNYLRHEMKLLHNSGTKYSYSNIGFGILQYSLSLIARRTFEELLYDEIFHKYSMINTSSCLENCKTQIISGLQSNGKEANGKNYNLMTGSGAILSTSEDLSKFISAHFSPNSECLIRCCEPTFKINDEVDIGLGWHMVKKEWGHIHWHNGGSNGYVSSLAMDLKKQKGVVVLSNVSVFHTEMGNIDRLCFEILKNINY